MKYHDLILEKKDRIATLTLNRPDKLNAFSMAMIKEARQAVNEVEKDNTVRALIITGMGRGFSAGLEWRNGRPASRGNKIIR